MGYKGTPEYRSQKNREAQLRYLSKPENRLAHQARVAKNHAKYDKAIRQFMAEAKAKPCMDCGGSFIAFAMDFDHVRGEKIADISYMVVRRRPLAVIKEEIAKCELVCATCHRIRTWNRKQAECIQAVEESA